MGLPQILPRDNNADCTMKERRGGWPWVCGGGELTKESVNWVNEQLGRLQVMGQANKSLPSLPTVCHTWPKYAPQKSVGPIPTPRQHCPTYPKCDCSARLRFQGRSVIFPTAMCSKNAPSWPQISMKAQQAPQPSWHRQSRPWHSLFLGKAKVTMPGSAFQKAWRTVME